MPVYLTDLPGGKLSLRLQSDLIPNLRHPKKVEAGQGSSSPAQLRPLESCLLPSTSELAEVWLSHLHP